mmetsp:Transcript_5441/g.11243  ORF Transcript_5441/g.11243 Transcript_5441/m.11243 type:complete len:257 (+) Transcript_5441:799-1569(+)
MVRRSPSTKSSAFDKKDAVGMRLSGVLHVSILGVPVRTRRRNSASSSHSSRGVDDRLRKKLKQGDIILSALRSSREGHAATIARTSFAARPPSDLRRSTVLRALETESVDRRIHPPRRFKRIDKPSPPSLPPISNDKKRRRQTTSPRYASILLTLQTYRPTTSSVDLTRQSSSSSAQGASIRPISRGRAFVRSLNLFFVIPTRDKKAASRNTMSSAPSDTSQNRRLSSSYAATKLRKARGRTRGTVGRRRAARSVA